MLTNVADYLAVKCEWYYYTGAVFSGIRLILINVFIWTEAPLKSLKMKWKYRKKVSCFLWTVVIQEFNLKVCGAVFILLTKCKGKNLRTTENLTCYMWDFFTCRSIVLTFCNLHK